MKNLELHTSDKERDRESREKIRFSTIKSGWGHGFVTKPIYVKRMLLPHFWNAWFWMFFLCIIVNILPYGFQMWLGRKIGRLMGLIIPARKYVLKRNLELAFPEMPEDERHRLAKDVQRNAGQAIFETGIAWFWPDWRLKMHYKIDEEDVRRTLEYTKNGKPILLLSAHFVTLELMARIFGTVVTPGIGVYRPSDHPVWEYMQVKGRTRKNYALVSKNDPKSMILALKSGKPIWYAPDQDYGPRVSVFAPFFGVKDTATVSATSTLAKMPGTRVVPAWTIREGNKYHLYLRPAVTDFPQNDAIKDATTVNHIIEEMVKMAPEQYLWMHRRFKTAPDPEENRYPKLKS